MWTTGTSVLSSRNGKGDPMQSLCLQYPKRSRPRCGPIPPIVAVWLQPPKLDGTLVGRQDCKPTIPLAQRCQRGQPSSSCTMGWPVPHLGPNVSVRTDHITPRHNVRLSSSEVQVDHASKDDCGVSVRQRADAHLTLRSLHARVTLPTTLRGSCDGALVPQLRCGSGDSECTAYEYM